MEEAGKEELELAIQLDEVDSAHNIPYVTVIANGAWSKRSYNVNTMQHQEWLVFLCFSKIILYNRFYPCCRHVLLIIELKNVCSLG